LNLRILEGEETVRLTTGATIEKKPSAESIREMRGGRLMGEIGKKLLERRKVLGS